MTIHEFPRLVPQSRARSAVRSGEPWTDDDYTTLLKMAREGDSDVGIADALQRSPSAVQVRAKRLLPLDQRGVPSERVIQHLGDLAKADDDYPWATHLAATPPPRPVVEHVHPPARYAGVEGLEDPELLPIAAAFAWGPMSVRDEDLASRIASMVVARGLSSTLRNMVEEDAYDFVGAFLDRAHGYGAPGWDDSRWGGRGIHPAWGGVPPLWPEEPSWEDEPPPEERDEPPFA